jgi:hypothetical protein
MASGPRSRIRDSGMKPGAAQKMAINGHHHRDANRSSGCRNKRCRQNAEDSRKWDTGKWIIMQINSGEKLRERIAGKNWLLLQL